MDIATLQELTGITILAADQPRYVASIQRSQILLESLLGYTLDADKVDINEWSEEVPTYAFRVFNVRSMDEYIKVDPNTAVHGVYMIYLGNASPEALTEAEDYITYLSNGWIRYLEVLDTCLDFNYQYNSGTLDKIAVDADWIGKTEFPVELMTLWANTALELGDLNRGIKSETLGSHRYEKFGGVDATGISIQDDEVNKEVLKRFAGPKGSIFRMAV